MSIPRIVLLFALSLGLLAGQAVFVQPVQPSAFEVVWEPEHQLLPIAVPAWQETVGSESVSSFRELLERRSVAWPGAEGRGACELFVRVSRHHWARRPFPRSLWPEDLVAAVAEAGEGRRTLFLGRGFLDDGDGDGDLLEGGELSASGEVEAELVCDA